MMGTVVGQPQRRRLKVDDDPFGAVGFYRGSMLVKPAIELWTGYDTNPARINNGKGSWLYMVAPELLVASDWQQHSLIADLRGSFTGYSLKNEDGTSALPVNIDRPDFIGKVNGRLDVSRDTTHQQRDAPADRHRQSGQPEHPGQPGALSAVLLVRQHARRRAQLQPVRDRRERHHRSHRLSGIDAERRIALEQQRPQLQPVWRLAARLLRNPAARQAVRRGRDRSARARPRIRPQRLCAQLRAATPRGSARPSSSAALITGEASIGYTTRTYEDARLQDAKGLLAAGSLIWKPTGLTTVTFGAQSSIDESTLPGVSGVITRSYNAQVEHAFRRYLIAHAEGRLHHRRL